jgi:hypothetical protein
LTTAFLETETLSTLLKRETNFADVIVIVLQMSAMANINFECAPSIDILLTP